MRTSIVPSQRISFAPGRPLESLPSPLRRSVWLVLSVFALLALTLAGPRSRLRAGGVGAGAVAAVWAAAYVLTYVHEQPWAAKVLLTYALTAGIVLMAALLAREAWPDRVYAPALAAAATALLPTVFRIGLVFHPDPLFALLALTAVLLTLRARRDRLAPRPRDLVGAALGSTALVRQSAPIIVIAVGAIVVLLGRRRAAAFALVALAATFSSPAPGGRIRTLGSAIRSSRISIGPDTCSIVSHARSSSRSRSPTSSPTLPESFRNELLPKFHAELWSDWFGADHDWASRHARDRVLASSQSILGFGGDALVLGGLVGFGIPALRRAMRNSTPPGRRRPRSADDPLPAGLGRLRRHADPVSQADGTRSRPTTSCSSHPPQRSSASAPVAGPGGARG